MLVTVDDLFWPGCQDRADKGDPQVQAPQDEQDGQESREVRQSVAYLPAERDADHPAGQLQGEQHR